MIFGFIDKPVNQFNLVFKQKCQIISKLKLNSSNSGPPNYVILQTYACLKLSNDGLVYLKMSADVLVNEVCVGY